MEPLASDSAVDRPEHTSRPFFGSWRFLSCNLVMLVAVISGCAAQTQEALPFEVLNPKNQKWSALEAGRIYDSACGLLARTIRPENPPRLHPKFQLVLGADSDEYVRDGRVNKIQLKSWNAEKFAEAVVLGAVREVLRSDDLRKLAHESVSLADATISAKELERR